MSKGSKAGRQGEAQESQQHRGEAKKKLDEARQALRNPKDEEE
jgi:hypothetical protein